MMQWFLNINKTSDHNLFPVLKGAFVTNSLTYIRNVCFVLNMVSSRLYYIICVIVT